MKRSIFYVSVLFLLITFTFLAKTSVNHQAESIVKSSKALVESWVELNQRISNLPEFKSAFIELDPANTYGEDSVLINDRFTALELMSIGADVAKSDDVVALLERLKFAPLSSHFGQKVTEDNSIEIWIEMVRVQNFTIDSQRKQGAVFLSGVSRALSEAILKRIAPDLRFDIAGVTVKGQLLIEPYENTDTYGVVLVFPYEA